ncbi:raptor N-terminal caspase like domain-domain-containing protein [Catenaria anguillulae PL171]|uniref:Raptor N-terminal caspase like domain-domain-containing protein n=1 Tax=Catenaria anguillulae PL171 TaxID=765915 RepID=A0A1Y2HPB7_9FUNG|nr:raptor N-terminal caspase like domain-domain-containing protein [Catenaria anguillulae PL171]
MVLPTDPPVLYPGMRGDVLPASIAHVLSARSTNTSDNRNPNPVAHLCPVAAPLSSAADDDPDNDPDNPSVLGREWALPSIPEWRASTRIKTVSVGIVVCLNIGVTPPDQPKPDHAAKMHAWVDPFKDAPPKSLELIGKNLQSQYEVLHPRARYRVALDATIEETKKLCMAMRRSAKEERVLFHYNGHGVPKPTQSGELWVFNKNYTQYIPVSVYDLQTWLGSPAVYVWDCSAAGTIVQAFNQFVVQRDAETQMAVVNNPMATMPPLFADSVQFAACGPNETLPWTPDLPADIFTSCLTTPITMALRWFLLTHPHARAKCALDLVSQLPGRLTDRRTPLGELNWIFTAVTDTIAWSVLPRDLFRRLFRQDLLLAALFRNYLLAHRILRHYGCTPMTSPALPDTTDMHPLWAAWDLVVDLVVDQLPGLIAAATVPRPTPAAPPTSAVASSALNPSQSPPPPPLPMVQPVEYIPSTFFAEQLSAFEVWLSLSPTARSPPLQLPIVLQVLLSQHHRLRALIILSKFLDLGPWAVAEALQVGIFPYVAKLLQSPAPELKPVLVFIWTRILAVDPVSCQADLMKDVGYAYFVHVLSPSANLVAVTDVSEHRAMCAFILATLCHGFHEGQAACVHHSVLPLAAQYLKDPDDLLRQWSCICIAQVCHQFSDAILAAVEDGIHQHIMQYCLPDAVTEVRAAAVLALGTFLQLASPQLQPLMLDMVTGLLPTMADASPLVRVEGTIAVACFVSHHRGWFEAKADEMVRTRAEEQENLAAATANGTKPATGSRLAALVSVPEADTFDTVAGAVWKVLLMASVDPDRAVARIAQRVVDAVLAKQPIYPPCSHLFERSRRYFAEPQLHAAEPRQPESVRDLERRWTFCRNRSMVLDSCATSPALPDQSWSQALTFPLPTSSASSSSSSTAPLTKDRATVRALRIHAFEPVLYAAAGNNVCAYTLPGLDQPSPSSATSITLPPPTQLCCIDHGAVPATALELIHEDAYSLLAVGSADGCVRVWRDILPYSTAYLRAGEPAPVPALAPTLATTWRALPDLTVPRVRGAAPDPLVLKWISSLSALAVAGASRVVRVWDLERDQPLHAVHTRSAASITGVTCDALAQPHVLVTSGGDGAVRVLDVRMRPTDALVATFKEHKAWCVGVDVGQCPPQLGQEVQAGLAGMVVSASAAGDVRVWDLRAPSRSVAVVNAFAQNASLSAFALHPYAPVAVTGSAAQQVKVVDLRRADAKGDMGRVSQTVTHYDGFLGQRLGKVASMTFHPLFGAFAIGAGAPGAPVVTVYRSQGGVAVNGVE